MGFTTSPRGTRGSQGVEATPPTGQEQLYSPKVRITIFHLPYRDTEVTSSFQTSRGVNGQTRASSTLSRYAKAHHASNGWPLKKPVVKAQVTKNRTNSMEMLDSSSFQEERQR